MKEIDRVSEGLIEILQKYPEGLVTDTLCKKASELGLGARATIYKRIDELERQGVLLREKQGRQNKPWKVIVKLAEGAKILKDVRETLAMLDDAHQKIMALLLPCAKCLGSIAETNERIKLGRYESPKEALMSFVMLYYSIIPQLLMTKVLFTWHPKIEQKTVRDKIFSESFEFVQRLSEDVTKIIKIILVDLDRFKPFWLALNIFGWKSFFELPDEITVLKERDDIPEEIKKAFNELVALLDTFPEYRDIANLAKE